MKKIWLGIGVIAVLGTTLLSAGCKTKVEGGKEAVKLLLAQERLDEKLLEGNLDALWNGAQESVRNTSGVKVNAVAPMGLKNTLVASADDEGFEDKGEYYEWTKFPAYSSTFGQFESFIDGIERQATDTAELIAKMKDKVGVTDKWVKNAAGYKSDCMLRVKEDAEYLFVRSESYYEVGKRYTRADAKNVYETYSYYNYEDGTTGDIRAQYIPGERYESMYDNDNGFKDYVIAENSRGYWTLMRFGTFDGSEYSFDVCVIRDGVGYNSFVQLQDDGISSAWYTVLDPESGREYFRLRPRADRWEIELSLCALGEGFGGLRAYGDLKDQVYRGRDGYEFEYPTELAFVTKNGEVQAGDSQNGVSYNGARVVIEPFDRFYHGELSFEVATSENAHVSEVLEKLDAYFNSYGVKTLYDHAKTCQGVEFCNLLTQEFGTTYSWYGYPLNSLENANKARAELLEEYATHDKMYAEVKDFETVRARQKLASGVDFAKLTAFSGGESKYENGKITLSNATATLEQTALLEAGAEYGLHIGLSLVNEAGDLSSVNTVSMKGGSGRTTVFAEGATTLTCTQAGEFILPKNLGEGRYAVVAYVADTDGLRVSEMQPIAFYEAEEGELESEAMRVTTAKAGNNLLVTYEIQLSVWAVAEENKKYKGSELERVLLREALACGYPKTGESITDENGEEVAKDEELPAGVYRLKIYLPTADGISEAFVYCEIQ